jgi:hypothetical protein
MFNLTNVGLSMCRNYLAWREKFDKIPTWRGKVSIVLMLINPAWWEKFGVANKPHDKNGMQI